jgi:hypothetical protein
MPASGLHHHVHLHWKLQKDGCALQAVKQLAAEVHTAGAEVLSSPQEAWERAGDWCSQQLLQQQGLAATCCLHFVHVTAAVPAATAAVPATADVCVRASTRLICLALLADEVLNAAAWRATHVVLPWTCTRRSTVDA